VSPIDEAIRKMTILLVEDDEDTRALVEAQFSHRGFTGLSSAASGAEATELLRQGKVDLVLLDLMLPDVDGMEFLDKLVNEYGLPVVVATCRDDKRTQMHCLEFGAADYLIKPFDADILILKVEKILATIHLQERLESSRRRNQRLFLNILQVMAKTLEAKDPYTKYHSENVARYARMIGRKMGLDEKEIELLQIAGILHDFGKIGIKEGLLNKPGALEPDEYEIIKRHPMVASAILEPLEELEAVIAFIRHHHEFYNGQGYPAGLAADDIPLGARILMVADAFDAMRSKRSYREPRTREEAMEELKSCAGSQFDPKVVEAFLDALATEEQRFVRDRERRTAEAGGAEDAGGDS